MTGPAFPSGAHPRPSSGAPDPSASADPRASSGAPDPSASADPRASSAAAARGARLRLFVALDLPAEAVAALTRFRDAAADPLVWRPLDAATFHVTLAFLGHRPEAEVAVVGEVLAALPPREPPALALGAALLLPPRRARVLTVALADESGTLATLQREVSDGLAGAGVYRPEERPFRPHVTVARIRPDGRAPRTIDPEPDPVAFAGGPVVLYRSHVRRGGATYEPLITRMLA